MFARNEESRKQGLVDKWGTVPLLSESMRLDTLDHWLQRFEKEAKRKDSSPYLAITLKHLCAGIQQHMRDVFNQTEVSIFDGPDFHGFRKTLDARMKELNKEGIKTHPKQAQPLTKEQEAVFWDKEVFNWIDSKALQHAMYFYTSKVFGLRAADEHVELWFFPHLVLST